MARLETSAVVWLGLLGTGIVAIVGVGGYAAYRIVTRPVEVANAPHAEPATPEPEQRQPAVPVPQFIAHDAERLADEAYRDLWAAISRGDANVAAKYVPAAKLQDMKTRDEVIDSFLGLSPIEDVRVAKGMTSGNKAVLFVTASSPTITDARGRRSPIDVVVRMVQEDGHWKVDQQIWLVATEPAEHQATAMAWLKAR